MPELLDENGVLSKEIIQDYDYIKYKNDIKYNINNKYKKNNKTNSIISYDEDGTMLWNIIRCESKEATEEEQKQMEALLMPFQNQSKRINDNNIS